MHGWTPRSVCELKRHVFQIEGQQERLHDIRVDGDIERETYSRKDGDMRKRIVQLTRAIKTSDQNQSHKSEFPRERLSLYRRYVRNGRQPSSMKNMPPMNAHKAKSKKKENIVFIIVGSFAG